MLRALVTVSEYQLLADHIKKKMHKKASDKRANAPLGEKKFVVVAVVLFLGFVCLYVLAYILIFTWVKF